MGEDEGHLASQVDGAIASASVSDVKAVSFESRPSIPPGFNPLSPRLAVLARPVPRNVVSKHPPNPEFDSAVQAAIERQQLVQRRRKEESAQQLEARRAARLAERETGGFDGVGGVGVGLQASSESAIPPGASARGHASSRGLPPVSSRGSTRGSRTGIDSSRQSFASLFGKTSADTALPLTAPLQPTGSRRVLYAGSAANDSYAMSTAKLRDARAIANTPSYYNTQGDPPAGIVYAHLITNNPKRDLAQALKRETIEEENRKMLDLRTSKAFRSPYRQVAFPPVRQRLAHNNDRQRQLYWERLERENRLYWQRIGRQRHHVENEKKDHDFHLGRTVMYPVLLGEARASKPPPTASPRVPPTEHHKAEVGQGGDSTSKDATPAVAASGLQPTPPKTAPPPLPGLARPRRRMTVAG